jgi:Starvation-inducible outer membrane lipoprotein
LGSRTDAPKASNASKGRFLILVDKYLDPNLYQKRKRITVAGEILGEQIKPLGEMDYRYPLISSKQIHLWEEQSYGRFPFSIFLSVGGVF